MKATRRQNLIAAAFACGLAAIAVLGSVASANAADKPNIVFILADNRGYGEVGAYGGGTQLPQR